MKTEIIQVHPLYPDLSVLGRCVKTLKRGGLVVFPTETVYGIGVDLTNPKAVHKLAQVKRRSDNKPFPILISSIDFLPKYTPSSSPVFYKLISEFWPGPLTIVVPAREEGQTLGFRMPSNHVALRLIHELGQPLASSSANIEGQPPPLNCREALRDFDGLVDMALDAGSVELGVPSTVISLKTGRPELLRQGAVKFEHIERVSHRKTVLFICSGNSCRSVMAEYMMKSILKNRDDVEVLSAGTNVFLHSTASEHTIELLREEGMDASQHRSRPIDMILLKKADLILVMTQNHRAQVLSYAHEIEKRVYLLREFAGEASSSRSPLDIPDPMGSSLSTYRECFNIIKKALVKVKELI